MISKIKEIGYPNLGTIAQYLQNVKFNFLDTQSLTVTLYKPGTESSPATNINVGSSNGNFSPGVMQKS